MDDTIYRTAFEHSRSSLWIEDVSRLRARIHDLKPARPSEVASYLDAHPEFVREAASLIEIIDINAEMLRRHGIAERSAALGPLDRILDPQDEQNFARIREDILAVADGTGSPTRETMIRSSEGSELFLLVSTRCTSTPDGHDLVIVTEEDISPQKVLQQKLEEERTLLLTLINNIPDYIYLKDADTRFVLGNRALAELMGAGIPDGLVGKTDFDFYPKELAQRYFSDDMSVIHTGVPIIDQEEESMPNAVHTRFALTTKVPIRDSHGRITGIVGVGRDITERKEAEERLGAFIHQSTEAIWIVGEDGTITQFNPSAEELTGIPRSEAIGKPAWSLISHLLPPDIGTPDIQRRMRAEILEAVKTGNAQSLNRLITTKLQRADGTIRTFEQFYFPIRTSTGYEIGAIAHDITESRELQETLRKVEAQLHQSQKMEAVGQLAGGVAHDFNNILTSIMGFAGLLRTQLEAEDRNQELVTQIVNAAKRAAHVTEALLVFSRKSHLSFKVLDLNRLAADHVDFLDRVLGEDVRIQLARSSEMAPVRADPTQIEQVLMNLATNARDAMPHGGEISIRIERVDLSPAEIPVRASPGTYVCMSVADDGVGIDEKTQPKIFEPFFTTKPVGKGSGLGLSIVWGIVDQHRGFITVESTPPRGSTFRVYLPVVGQQPDSPDALAEIPEIRGTETILVAEDEDVVRRLVRSVLEGAGYGVLEAADGEQAMDLYQRNLDRIDLVLLDIVMPKLDGNRLLHAIRRLHADQKVLFMSGYPHEVIEKRGIDLRGLPLIQKPFTPYALAERVRTILDR